jgi:anti-sigma-K factor RskA
MTRYWHQHPETIDRVAAEYALGTLAEPAARRLRTLMQHRADVAQAVNEWHARLGGALAAQPPLDVHPAAWTRLETRLFQTGQKTARTTAWWWRWLSPIPATTLALGLLLGGMLVPLWEMSRSDTQLPESYVGVLANRDGKPGLVVSSLRKGLSVDLKQLSPVEVPDGQTLFLWTIDQEGTVHAVSAIPNGPFVSAPLIQPAEATFFSATELAVSVETAGSTPQQPSGPFVYRGLCGKLWKRPAP